MTRDTGARVATILGWTCTAGVGGVLVTQAVGWDGTSVVAILQSLTPIGLAIMVVVASASALAGTRGLTIVASLVVLGALVLAAPLAFHGDHRAPAAGTAGLSVASVNLLHRNDSIEAVADELLLRTPDVIAFSEYVPRHRAKLDSHVLASLFPHRVDLDLAFGSGMAVWSRFPIVDRGPAVALTRGIDVTIDGPDGPVRIVAVHPQTPVRDFDQWRDALDLIGRQAVGDRRPRDSAPTVVVGDLNASYWHPAFRRLLRQGLADAHIASGAGWSASWPTDELIPPFVRLDHALTDDRLAVIDLVDFQPPGSDHRAFVVTVAPTELSRAR